MKIKKEVILLANLHLQDSSIVQGSCMKIQVKACGISYLDATVRKGELKELHEGLPHVLGYEISGIVNSIGEQVSRFAPGDPVVG